jgi:hypothetical protein
MQFPMQALKGLVIGLGFLIIFGFVLLIYGFYTKMSDPEFRVAKDRAAVEAASPAAPPAAAPARSPDARPAAAPSAPAASGALPGSFGEVRVTLPAGCQVAEMRPDGDRLYLRTGPEGACERIIIIDPTRGQVLGTVLLQQ